MLRSAASIFSKYTRFKSNVIKPIINFPSVRNFGETIVDISGQGHFKMKVKLHPYTQDQITIVTEGNQITLEARSGDVVESHTTYSKTESDETTTTTIQRTTSPSHNLKAYQTLILPPDTELNSVRTKFDDGDFVVTGYIRSPRGPFFLK
uniref:SHSP domain-containing protein n=1 Tax=Clastoptera arizonana TaxID=38151 RepID=A0A1B6DWL4_9HEMI